MEIWKDIPEYEGLYQVSNMGRVKSIPRKGKVTETIFKPATNRYGYQVICLRKNNIQKTRLIHRLVALSFIGIPPDKTEVNHINGNKADNHVENLEYCTARENMLHSYTLGRLSVRGERNGLAKLSPMQVQEIRILHASGNSLRQIALMYNVSKPTISDIISKRCWKHI